MNTQFFKLYFVLFIPFFAICNGKHSELDKYLVQAGKNNPEVRAAFYEYQAALKKIPQVRSLPDPQLSFGVFLMPMERYAGNQIAEIQLMQMFPWFGTLNAAEDEAVFTAKAKFERFKEKKSQLYNDVKSVWFNLYMLEKEVEITEKNIRILKTLEKISLSRFKGGGKTTMGGRGMADVLRVQMEVNELKNRLDLLKDKEKPLVTRFNSFLDIDSNQPISLPNEIADPELPIPASEISENIKNNNPMIKMLEKEELALQAQIKKNQRMSYPMVGLGVQYGVFRERPGAESSMNGRDMIMPMVSITLPIWREKYNSAIEESELKQKATRQQKRELNNQLLVNYEEVLRAFNDAKRRIQFFENQIKLAKQALNILTSEYSTSGTNFEEVLRMQQQLLDYDLKFLQAQVEGNISSAMMERLMGR